MDAELFMMNRICSPRLSSPVYRLPFLAALFAGSFLTHSAQAQRGGLENIGRGGAIGAINDLQPGRRVAAKPGDEEPTPPSDVPVLYLHGDDWLTGAPAASGQPNKLGWQSPYFTRPFEFDLSAVNRVRFSAAVAPGWRDHDYRLELAGGDVLYGEIVGVSDDNLLFRSSLAGELRIKRSAVRCLERCKANPLIYLGPNGLGEWQAMGDAWREEEGALVSDKDGSQLYRAIELPARALVEFEVSSLFPPVFRLSLGVGEGEAIRRDGFRLEVVDFDVIAVYETDSDIDVARVMTLSAGPERDTVHLRVLFDQHEQRADVFSAEGLPLASVQVKSDDPRVLPGICLEHKRGGLRFERLRVWNWSGSLPKSLAVDRPQLHQIDGTVVDGLLAAYNAERRQFTVATADGQVTCADDRVARIYFGQPDAPENRPLRVSCIDGTLLSGWFAGIDGQRLSLDCVSIDTPVLESPSLPLAALAGMAFSYPPAEDIPSRALVMRLDGGRMHGQLAPGRAEEGHSAIFWLPAGATQSSPLRDGASAQIVAQSLARFGLTGGNRSAPAAIRQAEIKRQTTAANSGPGQDSSPERPRDGRDGASVAADTIYLTTGDTFKCEIVGLDDHALRCRTASAEKQIPAANVKAIDLGGTSAAGRRARTLDEMRRQERAMRAAALGQGKMPPNAEREKVARLLVLPRLNRDDPPTHVLCAVNGDFLRGRLLVMSQSSLRFAVGENEREFPRDRVEAIVWLHPEPEGDLRPGRDLQGPQPADGDRKSDDADGPAATEAAGPETASAGGASPPNLAHAVCTDGTRLTFTVTEIDGDVIAGVSDILGECQLPLGRLSELLLGERVRQAASEVAYHDWTLTPAPEPKAFLAGDPAAESGGDSALVGKPAPDFELDLIDGGKFRLSQHRGRTIVLDFWASWCAPCVKGLPKVAQTVAEAEGGQVELVAVNLRESAEQAKAALDRMELNVTAALDRDGAVAARYGATAIPQTVVVGADGQVLRVFVGAGLETEKQLKATLEQSQQGSP
jgi:thiol-disulfide isomerase/thioredoxin